ncbi:MAG TPA: PBP1A family penicillin-binding protein, partial [Caulobacterales bacterium]|nr:PBP1A family penicillin-binding protein [Caulobacterales bacterium]
SVPNAEGLWTLNRQPGITFIDMKGRVLGIRGPYYGHGVKLDDLPAYLPQAFLAIEDQRFYEHGGVDRQAIARAAAANLMHMRTVQGGSTITQQLCKNLFLTPDRSIRRKLQEMILAGRVERKLSKREILELYLNRIYLGEQAYGVDAAARRYFGKGAADVTLAEAAILAALPKAPSQNDPMVNFAGAKARQEVVLQAMVDAKFISPEQAASAEAQKIKIAKREGVEVDLGYVFDMATDQARQLVGDRAPDMVVRVTVDPALQAAAARAVRANVPATAKGKPGLQAALVSVDENGAIKALIGGRSYQESKFNRAVQAKRQPGSSFKTFVYAAAFEQGYDPDTVRYDEPITINGWQPKNYYGEYQGAVSLRTAFALSINTVAAQVGHEVGEANVVKLAHRFGIQSDLPAVPSLALGTAEVTPLEMTQAYSTFMRGGRRIDAYIVQAVENSRGDVLYNRPAYEAQQVYDPDLNKRMVGMLGHVVQAGTGTRARLPDRDAAGKTGTSQDWRDAWFVGFTADYTTGVWIGYDNSQPMNKITGGAAPAAIWANYMTNAEKTLPPRDLPGYNLPPRPARDFQLATFYDSLAAAFGFHRNHGDDDDDGGDDDGRDIFQ